MFDFGTLANIVMWMIGAGVGGLAWLFKLHGDVRVLKSDLQGAIELRKALENRVNGMEDRIFEELQAIRQTLNMMARQQQ